MANFCGKCGVELTPMSLGAYEYYQYNCYCNLVKPNLNEMTEKRKDSGTLKQLTETAARIRTVLVNNGRTNTVVYGLLMSLHDDYERGAKPKTIKKEFQDAITLAKEQFSDYFKVVEQPKKEDE